MTVHRLDTHPLHLGLQATAVVEPGFGGGNAWYDAYLARHAADGLEGRLVAMWTFDAPWTMWEMHPHGHEVVLCTSGAMTLIQEGPDGSRRTLELRPGEYAINPPNVWHTADIEGVASAVFVTPGVGTQHRPREA
jgi:quercetin dioxygenase-like cupin family protein